MNLKSKYYLAILIALTPCLTYAGELNIPHSFVSGTKAVAADVNENFQTVKTEVSDNHSRINALESALTSLQQTVIQLQSNLNSADQEITTLQDEITNLNGLISSLDSSALASRVTQIENNPILALDQYIQLDQTEQDRPTVVFSNTNVQITNGLGVTNAVNGVGNLIIGYNEKPAGFLTQERAGSHNLVIGRGHRYSSHTGLIAGVNNTITGPESSITAGNNISLGTAQWASINITADSNNLDLTSAASINITAGDSINYQAANDQVFSAGNNISVAASNIFSLTTTDTAFNSDKNFQISSGTTFSLQSGQDINIAAGTDVVMSATANASLLSGTTASIISNSNVLIKSSKQMDITAGGTLTMKGSKITQN